MYILYQCFIVVKNKSISSIFRVGKKIDDDFNKTIKWHHLIRLQYIENIYIKNIQMFRSYLKSRQIVAVVVKKHLSTCAP